MSLVGPHPPLRACAIEDPPSRVNDVAYLLSQDDELCWHYQTTGGMAPPDQNLGTDNLPGVDEDDRLVVQLELLALHSLGELGTLSHPGHHPGVKVVVVPLYAALSALLRRVQSQI